MMPFSTEFPVSPVATKAAFIAQVVGWLRGTQYSEVLSSGEGLDLSGDSAHLKSKSGEELRLRELVVGQGESAIGFRHDYPDTDGRIWRTEAVLSGIGSANLPIVRVKTQCLAGRAGALIETPRKLFLVKAMLQDGWGANDGWLTVQDQPHAITDDDDGLFLAKAIVSGEASAFLPIVYVSTTKGSAWALSGVDVDKLAYDLGGVAHVVVEPSRSFSFKLMETTGGRNAYGGAVAVSIPVSGLVRRAFLGLQLPDARSLAVAVRQAVADLRSQMPASGIDWSELQEQALRNQRAKDRENLTFNQLEDSYLEEINELKEQVLALKLEKSASSEIPGQSKVTSIMGSLSSVTGPEIYEGELSDRLCYAAQLAVEAADRVGLDIRSRHVLGQIAQLVPRSPALSDLKDSLRRATKDPKKVRHESEAVHLRHGYEAKSENKHVRLEAKPGLGGLESITLPKTPSDGRGLENLRKQMEHALGISQL